MATILGNKPRKVCPNCRCFFEFDASDVKRETEQVWVGFFLGGYDTITHRYIICPGCGKKIIL